MENPGYDRENAVDGRVQYSEQVQKIAMEADDMGERLVDSLANSSKDSLRSLDQHTDVLIVEDLEQYAGMLAKEYKALMPYGFYSNKSFVNTGIVAEYLTQLSSQMQGEEVFCSRRQEGVDDRVAVETETRIRARSQQVTG